MFLFTDGSVTDISHGTAARRPRKRHYWSRDDRSRLVGYRARSLDTDDGFTSSAGYHVASAPLDLTPSTFDLSDLKSLNTTLRDSLGCLWSTSQLPDQDTEQCHLKLLRITLLKLAVFHIGPVPVASQSLYRRKPPSCHSIVNLEWIVWSPVRRLLMCIIFLAYFRG